MRRRKGEPPRYLGPHKTGQAYCYFHGQVWLGKYGTSASHHKHQEILRAWRREIEGVVQDRTLPASGCSVLALVSAWLGHADLHYRHPDGEITSEWKKAKAFAGELARTHGHLAADEFRPAELRALRQSWIDRGCSTRTANSYVSRIRLIWRWGVSQELVQAATLTALEAMPNLREPGERPPVGVVASDQVAAALPFLRSPLAAMVRIHHLVGCRPGEIVRMRGVEIDRDGVARIRTRAGLRTIHLGDGVWVWEPDRFKTRHRGKNLSYLLGPQAQEILVPWLRDDPEEYLFRPIDGVEEGKMLRVRPGRVSKPVKVRKGRYLGRHYSANYYNYAIGRACEKAKIEHWHANQLRHTVLTRYDQLAGIEGASIIVQHGSVDTTAIYVERDLQRAADLVRQHG